MDGGRNLPPSPLVQTPMVPKIALANPSMCVENTKKKAAAAASPPPLEGLGQSGLGQGVLLKFNWACQLIPNSWTLSWSVVIGGQSLEGVDSAIQVRTHPGKSGTPGGSQYKRNTPPRVLWHNPKFPGTSLHYPYLITSGASIFSNPLWGRGNRNFFLESCGVWDR